MSITAAIIMFSMIWFLVFFVVLPLRFQSQAEAGEVVPGTPASAPSVPMVARKARMTTGVAAVVWAICYGTIIFGLIRVDDFDFTYLIVEPPPPRQ